MGKERTKREKALALIKWQRRRQLKCSVRAKYDQHPLPEVKVGDHILIWGRPFAPNCWYIWNGTPPTSKLNGCKCYGSHEVCPHFLRVLHIENTWVTVEDIDTGDQDRVYQSQIIMNIGPRPPLHPEQDFSGVDTAQKKLIIRVFMVSTVRRKTQ